MERNMAFSGERNIDVQDIDTTLVAPNGLGFGEGTISLQARKEELGESGLQQIDQIINSSDILVAVSTDKDGAMLDDDGCGDGREVSRVFEGNEPKAKSLNRTKVFGGGVTMTAATKIGLGEAKDQTLRDVYTNSIASLRDKMINFGAHTDTHSEHSPAACGCGAIDKAPIILGNAVKFKDEIRATIGALGIDTTGLDEVEQEYAEYVGGDMGEYSGQSVMDEIIENGKIVKELSDDHKEVVVVLNLVEGFTVDQEKIREATSSKAQAFAVDVWRVKAIADRLYSDDTDQVRHKAFLSELVYTLATAGTLTAGDLPVYVVAKQTESVTA